MNRPRFTTAAAVLLLVAEGLALTYAFDVEPLGKRGDGWAIVGQLGGLAALAVAALGGVLLLALLGEAGRWRSLLVGRPLDRKALAWLGLHAAGALGLLGLSAAIFGAAGPPAGRPGLWLAAWLGVAVLTGAAAGAAALPAGGAGAWLRTTAPLLGGGLLLGSSAWLVARGSQQLWHPLGPWTLQGSAALLRLFSSHVLAARDSAVLGTDRFQVIVGPECAGFEGLGLMAAFLTATLFLGRRHLRFPAALWLVPCGLAAVWLVNLVRIVALVLVGTHLSAEVAISGFHAKAGWLLFCALALSIVALARRSRLLTRQPVELGLAHPTAAFLLPFLTVLAVSFLTGLAARAIDYLYLARIIAGAAVAFGFRGYYRGIGGPQPGRGWGRAVALGGVAFALYLWLSTPPAPEAVAAWQAQWAATPPWLRAVWIASRALGSVLVIPIVEELAFRGYLLRRVIAREFETVPPAQRSWPALGLAAAGFGAVHGSFLAGSAAGIVLGLAQWAGGGITHAIIAHAVSNLAVLIYVLGFGGWWLWM